MEILVGQKWGDDEISDLEEIYSTDPDETAEAMAWKEADWDWEKVR
jgi:hypothetical protein